MVAREGSAEYKTFRSVTIAKTHTVYTSIASQLKAQLEVCNLNKVESRFVTQMRWNIDFRVEFRITNVVRLS